MLLTKLRKKKTKEDVEADQEYDDEEQDQFDDEHVIPETDFGIPSALEYVSPHGVFIEEGERDTAIIRETMEHNTYVTPWAVKISGYPRYIRSGLFNSIQRLGTTDFTIDIVAQSRAKSTKSLNDHQTVVRTNQEWHMKQGNRYQMRENEAKINDIEVLLQQIQFDENRMYNVSITGVTSGSNMKELQMNLGTLEDEMTEEGFTIMPLLRRVKSGILLNIPMGFSNPLRNTFRNMDRRASAKLDPARNGGGRFNGGIYFAVNRVTGNLEFFNTFGTPEYRPDNYNYGIVGTSGAGKSLSAKVKIGREVSLLPIFHRIIDPDGEFVDMTHKLGGVNINFNYMSDVRINPIALSVVEVPLTDIREDDELEILNGYENDMFKIIEKDGERYAQYVNVHEQLESISFFVELLVQSNGAESGLTAEEDNTIQKCAQKVFDRMGITTHPDSLFVNEDRYDEKTDVMYTEKSPKPEPTLSDIYEEVIKYIDGDQEKDIALRRLTNGIQPYLKDGSKPIFDGQTYFGEGLGRDLNKFKLVNFDISKFGEGKLRPIAYYVISNYLWERWLKNPSEAMKQKVLDCDELIQFLDNENMSLFFEKIARRIRKRNGSFCWMSQDIVRINNNPFAAGILSNTETYFFLKIKNIHKEIMKELFGLTDGEVTILTSEPEKGEGILKTSNQSIWIRTNPTEDEMKYAESNKAHRKAA